MAVAWPLATTVVKAASLASSHCTGMSAMAPAAGVTRVHRITRSLSGSPLATLWTKRSSGSSLPPQAASGKVPSAVAPQAIWRTKRRRPVSVAVAGCNKLVRGFLSWGLCMVERSG